MYGSSGTGPFWKCSRRCSTYSTGLSSRMAAIRQPLASYGVDGATTFRPGTCMKKLCSPCECWAPWPQLLPIMERTTSGTLDLPAVHVAALGGDVDELVHRQHQEVHADVDVDRPQPGQGHADGRAGHGVLGQRRAEDALRAVLLDQAARRALDRLGVVHVQAEEDDGRVAGHLLVGRLADGLDVGQRPLAGGRRGGRLTAAVCDVRSAAWSVLLEDVA